MAEDGDDMQIVVIGPYGDIYPLLQVVVKTTQKTALPSCSF